MSRWKRMWFAVLAFCVILSGLSMESMASAPAGKETGGSYTYRITLYAGKQGKFTEKGYNQIKQRYGGASLSADKNKIIIENVNYSSSERMVLPNAADLVSVSDDSKYYVKGIRLSGRDNNTAMESPSFLPQSDSDYVIAYGVKGDMVAYQVNFRDQAGNTLAPSTTYYGNVGDKPVVAFLYIEGYEPQAYNLTRTLQKDPSKNEFTFVYRRVATGTTTTTVTNDGTTVTTVPGSTTTTQGGTGGNTGGGTTGGGANQGDGDAEAENGTDENADNAEDNTEDIQDEQVPMAPGELVDLDEPEVPLAKLQNLIINPEGKVIYGYSILIGLSAAAALIIMGVIFWKKRRAGIGNEEIDNWELK